MSSQNNSHLLPPNASRLERNVAQLSVAMTNLPVAIVDLHRVAACPSAFLPWLAWARRVEYWDADWSDSQKRQVIADARLFNQQRGTRSSISSLLDQMLPTIDCQLIAWHELSPKGVPFSFVVHVDPAQQISIEQAQRIHTAVDATKSARDLYSVAARVGSQSRVFTAGATRESHRVSMSTRV